MASSAPSTTRRLLERQLAGHVRRRARRTSTSMRSPTLKRSAAAVSRVQANAARGSSTSCAPMRTRALPAGAVGHDVTTAGTMSPARIGCDQRSVVKRSSVVAFGDDVARRLRGSRCGACRCGAARGRARVRRPACSSASSVVCTCRPGLVERVGAVLLLERLADVFDEVRRDRALRRRLAARARAGCAAASRACVVGDEAFLRHPRQHVVVAPRQRAVRVDERAEPRRRLDDGGDRRRFLERQVLRRLVEVERATPPRRRRRRGPALIWLA